MSWVIRLAGDFSLNLSVVACSDARYWLKQSESTVYVTVYDVWYLVIVFAWCCVWFDINYIDFFYKFDWGFLSHSSQRFRVYCMYWTYNTIRHSTQWSLPSVEHLPSLQTTSETLRRPMNRADSYTGFHPPQHKPVGQSNHCDQCEKKALVRHWVVKSNSGSKQLITSPGEADLWR